MRKPAKILKLASALAALAAPAAAPPIADAAASDGAQIATETEEGIQAEAEISLPGDAELMSFTVHQTSDGMMFPQHQSHSSHASHVSHASSSPGVAWPNRLPDLPNPTDAAAGLARADARADDHAAARVCLRSRLPCLHTGKQRPWRE